MLSKDSLGQFELFISYSRKDNVPLKSGDANGWVTALRDEILADHRRFSTAPLRIFFDTAEIKSLDDWRNRILAGLRQSRILLVCLSNNYFESPPCHWEWEEYLKRQVHALIGEESVAPVYFVEVPDPDKCLNLAWTEACREESFANNTKRHEWEERWKTWHATVSRHNWIDLRPWFPDGINALREAEVRRRIELLGTSLWDRIRRARRASHVPGNLRRPNPHFVGRVNELRRLHENLALGPIGIITVVHGLGGQGKTELATAYAHGWADSYPAGLWMLAAEGKTEILPLLGELRTELGLPLSITAEETAEQRGRRVLAELTRRALAGREDQDPATAVSACLVLLDNVSEAALLSEPQLAQLPREEWLRIVATSRLGLDIFPASRQKSLAFVAVDALMNDDGTRLLEDHQPDGKWPPATDAADISAAREIAAELGGFTLVIENVAIYLGLHTEIRPAEYLTRLRAQGALSVDLLPNDSDVAMQMEHREKRLRLVLDQTLARLTTLERDALDCAALLPPEAIAWPWLRSLAGIKHPAVLEIRKGYPDPWLAVHRVLEGLRLLVPADHAEIARMHPLVSATVRELVTQRSSGLIDQVAQFICRVETPFAYELPIELYLRVWKLVSESRDLDELVIGQAARETVPSDVAEQWTDLSYQLGRPKLERWWLSQWGGEGITNHRYAQRLASFMHRQGQTKNACAVLRNHLEAQGECFETSVQLMQYLSQLGDLEEAERTADSAAIVHAGLLSEHPLQQAWLLHGKYFVHHDLDKNSDAVVANQFIRDVYVKNHFSYDYLIATVNLGDSYWGIGRLEEAVEMLELALSQGQSSGLAQVENIASICLANVLSSMGSHQKATQLYSLGEELSRSINQRWDLLYAQTYRGLHDLELKIAKPGDLESVRGEALEAGYGYLAALADAHICIASFCGIIDEHHLAVAMDRGLKSRYPAVRLYALSAMIRADFAGGRKPVEKQTEEWVQVLDKVQGVKGRMGVIAQTADWLLRTDSIQESSILQVRDWITRYVPHQLADFFQAQYPFPKQDVRL